MIFVNKEERQGGREEKRDECTGHFGWSEIHTRQSDPNIKVGCGVALG